MAAGRIGKKKAAAVAAAVLAGIVVLLLALLHTRPAEDYLLLQAREILRDQGLQLDAERLDLDLFRASLNLRDVELRSLSAPPELPPFLSAKRAFVDLGVWGLLKRRVIDLDEGLFEQLALNVVVDEEGRNNLPGSTDGRAPPRQEPSEVVPDFRLSRVRVDGGSLHFEDRRQGIRLEIPGWELHVDGEPAGLDHDLRLASTAEGALEWSDELPVEELRLRGRLSPERLELSLVVTLGDSRFAADGTIRYGRETVLDLSADTELDLTALSALASVEPAVTGAAEAEISLQGALPELRAAVSLEADDLRHSGWPEADVSGNFVWEASSNVLEVSSLDVSSPSGRIHSEGRVALDASSGRSHVSAELERVDLEALTRALDSGTRIASLADGVVEARWSDADVSSADADIRLALTASRADPAPDVVPLSGELTFEAREGAGELRISRLEGLGADLRGRVRVESAGSDTKLVERPLNGRLAVEIESIRNLTERIAALQGREGDPDGEARELQGGARMTVDLGGSVGAPRATARLESDSLELSELKNLSLRALASYEPDTILIQHVEITRDGGAPLLTLRGRIGLEEDAPLELDAEVHRAPIAPVVSAATGSGDVPVAGELSLRATVTGTRAAPLAEAELAVEELRAYGETWGRLSGRGVYDEAERGRLELRLDKPVDEGASGSLRVDAGFEPRTESYELRMDSENLRLSHLQIPGAGELEGTLRISASGSGRLADPELQLSLSGEELKLGERELGALSLKGRLERGAGDFELSAPWFDIRATSRIGLKSPYPVEFTLAAEGTDLSRLPLFGPGTEPGREPLRGTLTGSSHGTLTLARPSQASIAATVDELRVDYRDVEPVRLEKPLHVGYENEVLSVDSVELTSGGSRVALRGSLPLESSAGSGEISLDAKLELADLAAAMPREDVAAEGTASIEASLGGSLQELEPSLRFLLSDATITSPYTRAPVTNIGVDAELDFPGGLVSWQGLRAELGPAQLRSDGTLPLSWFEPSMPRGTAAGDLPTSVSVDLRNLPLQLLAAVPETLQGTVSFEGRGEAPVPDLDALDASLRFSELTLESKSDRIEQTGTTEILAREGRLRIDRFHLLGEQSELEVTGVAELVGERALELEANGRTDLATVAAALESVQMTGETRFAVDVGGTIASPELAGFLDVRKGELLLEEPEIAASELDLRLELEGERVRVDELRAELNGGRFRGSGGASLAGGTLRDVDLELNAEEVYLEAPRDLRTTSGARLRIASRDQLIFVEGDVEIQRGSYTDSLDPEDELFDLLGGETEIDLVEDRDPLLNRLRYDVAVTTVDPLLMVNNLADMGLRLDLRLGGTYYRPGLTGVLALEEGGEIFLRENTYVIDRGVVNFLNESRIEPALEVLARTRAGDYDVTLQLGGVPGDLETTLTSEPPLPEPDILAVLVTGRTLEEFRGEEVHVAQQHLLSYLAGRSTGRITSGIANALGLSEVRVEPHLVSAESDPTARLTIGQELTPDLRLVYSMNLTNSSDQIYIAQYDVTRRISTTATQQEDNTYRFDVGHRLEFGGAPNTGEPRSRTEDAAARIERIDFEGNDVFPGASLSRTLSLDRDDEYDFFEAREALKRLRSFYHDAGYLEARVRLDVEETAESAALRFHVEEGPRVSFTFAGGEVDDELRKRVREEWSEGYFDRQRAADVVEIIRASLVEEGYLESAIDSSIRVPAPDRKLVALTIEPGARYESFELAIEGVEQADRSRVDEILEALEARRTIHSAPDEVTERLAELYRSEGYLDVEIEAPEYELDRRSGSARAVLRVRENPRYSVGSVEFAGNVVFDDEQLRSVVPLGTDGPYRIEDRRNGIAAIEERYWNRGYNDVLVTATVSRADGAPAVRVVYGIEEGSQEVVESIAVEGTHETSEKFVRGQLEVSSGQPLLLDETASSRKNLYHTGAFARVELERVAAPQRLDGPAEKPVQLRVKVREVKPFSLRYGASYDTDNGPGGIVDFMNRNSLGSARTVGARGRYDGSLRELRAYFSQPLLRNVPLKTNVSGFFAREVLNREDGRELMTKRRGFSLEEELHLRDRYVFAFGYRYERTVNSFEEPGSDVPAGVPFVSAPATTTLTRDTRDDILDATRGSFSSHALEVAPELLGSDFGYLRYFGQYSAYAPLSDPSRIPWVDVSKTRWVYAGAVRLGLADELGGPFVPSARRFFAGGGTTLRGFEQDGVGPFTGGDAVLLLNQELRFPVVSFFDGVAFLDVGNVYPSIRDLDLTELRETAGLGLRVRTPYFLLRFDYGFKLDRRADESPGAFFFSIGQAF